MQGFADFLPPGVVVLDRLPPDAAARLTPGEVERHRSFPAEKRRQDWLLGRLAAKQAIERGWGAPPGLEIESAPSGAPRVRGLERDLALTITHGHGRAAAWALEPGARGGLPGLDLERIKPRPAGTLRFYLHPEERAWVEALAPADADEAGPRDVASIVCWALKEAAFKALQPPRGTGLLDVGLGPLEDPLAESGTAEVRYLNAAAPRAAALGVAGIEAGWVRRGDLVLAWVQARGAALPPA